MLFKVLLFFLYMCFSFVELFDKFGKYIVVFQIYFPIFGKSYMYMLIHASSIRAEVLDISGGFNLDNLSTRV